jgi:putative protease
MAAFTESHSKDVSIPEILAPAGGREQFFAALNSGADAVFLGLKNFNARARAENFTTDDLRELMPIAKKHGMKVLVTLNILIKNSELKSLVETLSILEDIGVHAIIVQDAGLARICRTYFPELRMHASTQLAVHNADGVRSAIDMGFRRVVLARELTAIEIKKIRSAFTREEVELEAFCHGSLCYSYSGLCFFSGAEDARSGNRGECAYTCRKPYKILNEPGHGFLFSMKDLNTIEHLELLVDAGVDTLKIEGRKKDAQYVSGVVQAYRKRLDQIYNTTTLRSDAPEAAHNRQTHESEKTTELSLGFQRSNTSFFLKGRYHENVIDLDNPTHKGQLVGTVESVSGRSVTLVAECELARFDGLRIDPSSSVYHSSPQHGSDSQSRIDDVVAKYNNRVCHFSLRSMHVDGTLVAESKSGNKVRIDLPEDIPVPSAGDKVYRTRSDAMRRHVDKLIKPPADSRLRALAHVDLRFRFLSEGNILRLSVTAEKFGKKILSKQLDNPALRPQNGIARLDDDIRQTFSTLGNIGFQASALVVEGDANWFVPRSRLKELKRMLESELPLAMQQFLSERMQTAIEGATCRSSRFASGSAGHAQLPQLSLKIDRLEYLPWIAEILKAEGQSESGLCVSELVFEPKRAFLPNLSFGEVIGALQEFAQSHGLRLRLALPTVLRAWDEPLMKRWAHEFFKSGITAVELGNVGHFAMLKRWGLDAMISSVSSDFTLYTLNQQAAHQWSDLGISTIALSVEDDAANMKSLLAGFPDNAQPQAILYKDTPLFIAESCSLTALHNGCPTSQVCGYRTLKIQNDEGEIFYVAHESCKSIVYAKQPFALSHKRSVLENLGVKYFRADFLTRLYDRESLQNVLLKILNDEVIEKTHTANFNRILL